MRCYVCNREMADRASSGMCKVHGEHIIHNGIGGRLISRSILCEDCGRKYSADDAKFVNLFGGFLEMLRDMMHFDRGGVGIPVPAYLFDNVDGSGGSIVVNVKGKNVIPIRGVEVRVNSEKSEVHVYAPKTIFESLF